MKVSQKYLNYLKKHEIDCSNLFKVICILLKSLEIKFRQFIEYNIIKFDVKNCYNIIAVLKSLGFRETDDGSMVYNRKGFGNVTLWKDNGTIQVFAGLKHKGHSLNNIFRLKDHYQYNKLQKNPKKKLKQ